MLHLLLCAILASLLAKLGSSSSFKPILKLCLPAHYLLSQFYIDNGDITCKEFSNKSVNPSYQLEMSEKSESSVSILESYLSTVIDNILGM